MEEKISQIKLTAVINLKRLQTIFIQRNELKKISR